MKLTRAKDPREIIIVTRTEPLSDDDITRAFHGNATTEWWKALMQLIEQYRSEYPASAATCAGVNNALGMARDVGAHEALTGLMLELQRRVSD